MFDSFLLNLNLVLHAFLNLEFACAWADNLLRNINNARQKSAIPRILCVNQTWSNRSHRRAVYNK